MKKIISLLIAIGVIGCEKVKLVTPEETERREMLEAVRTHTQVMEVVVSNIEEIGSILEDKEEITIGDVLHAVEEIDGVERDVKAKVSAVRRELEGQEPKKEVIIQFTKDGSIENVMDSVMREMIKDIENEEIQNFVEGVYNGLKECEDIEGMIKYLKNIESIAPLEEKIVEFSRELLEDGEETIYNEEWLKKYLEIEEKGLPFIAWVGIMDVAGGIFAGIHRKEEYELVKDEKTGEQKLVKKTKWGWDWRRAAIGGVGCSVVSTIGKFLPVKSIKFRMK